MKIVALFREDKKLAEFKEEAEVLDKELREAFSFLKKRLHDLEKKTDEKKKDFWKRVEDYTAEKYGKQWVGTGDLQISDDALIWKKENSNDLGKFLDSLGVKL